MVKRNTLVAGGAIALGAIAAVVALVVVNNARTSADAKTTAMAVFVVTKTVPAGTSADAAISAGYVKSDSIPRKFFPATAVTDLSTLKGKVSAAELPAGQIVVVSQFVQPQTVATSSSGITIPAGDVAITIALDPLKAVAGLIVPGDKIDLMSVFATPKAAGSSATDAGTTYAHFFYQNAEVLAIGTTLAPAAGATSKVAANPGSSFYTLAVPPEAAERIVLAAANGALTAALVPPNNKAAPIPAVNAGTIDGPPVFAPAPALTPSGK